MTDNINTHLALIESFDQTNSLVVGDIMLDKFVYGSTSRISPEAPIPVLSTQSAQSMPGGAGNVVRNITSLGGKASIISLIGDDADGEALASSFATDDNITSVLLKDPARQTTIKTRYIAGTQQLLRVDSEDTDPLNAHQADHITAQVKQRLEHHDCLILSDYAKGTLSPALLRRLIEVAQAANKPVLIDPKQWDIALYAGATLLCPNEKEATLLHSSAFTSDTEMISTAQSWCNEHSIQYVLITRGAKGMMLINSHGVVEDIRARGREVYDVSGAGDTVLATLACAYSSGATMAQAATLANHAAAIAVSRLGTATVYRTDLKTAIYTADTVKGRNKIFSLQAMQELVRNWQERGLKVGFTNGCFDIVHAGHISSLSHCKEYCDRLVLAINSDDSVKRLKGPARPVNNEIDRAMLLAALTDIDAVMIFREDTPIATLEALKPDVLMKGEDYQKEEIVGWKLIESYGGRVQRIPLVEGYSTTNTISKIQQGEKNALAQT